MKFTGEDKMTTQIHEVPLLDLQRQYQGIEEKVLDAFKEVLASKQFILGPKVDQLETEMAAYTEAKYAIGVSSGTDALVLALMALNIGPGDEVITTPFTFFATAGSIHRVGAKPVFVDIDETYNIDVTKIEEKITANTKAIMPVHLFGQMANMEVIMSIAEKYKLAVIEDAAQAIGSKAPYKGQLRQAGSIGTIGCFSYFPSKNLGCCGDAGLVTTNDESLAQTIKLIRVHGAEKRYHHKLVGGNFRIDPIQAAVLSIKLPFLNQQHELRRKNAEFYKSHLLGGVQQPIIKENYYMIYNQYTIRSKNRETLIEKLVKHHIGHAVYYPIPLHLQECFAYLGHQKGDFKNAELAANEVLSLPIFSELEESELRYVCEIINTN